MHIVNQHFGKKWEDLPSCFSEESLFVAEARSLEFEPSITVSFVLLSTLICTDPPTANSVERFEQN